MGFLADTETAVTAGFTAVANTFGAGLLGVFRPAFITGFTIWITLIPESVTTPVTGHLGGRAIAYLC
jgi:hypothetical protein